MSDASATWAIVPVKRFSTAKSRLAPVLNFGERALLAKLMFEDVLDCLVQCKGILAGTLVVTVDEDAAAIARCRGATVIGDTVGAGINAAVRCSVQHVSATGREGIIVVPSDIPQVCPQAIGTAAGAILEPPTLAVVAASSDGGTNLLACRPATAAPLCFGTQSYSRHRDAVSRAGLAFRQLHLGDLSLDLDRPDDLGAFIKRNSKTRTQEFLMRLAIWNRLDRYAHIGGTPNGVAEGNPS